MYCGGRGGRVGRRGGGGAGALEIGTVRIIDFLFRYSVVLCQVNSEPRLFKEPHCTELANIGLLARMGHLMQTSLVGIFKLFVTVRTLVGPHLHRLAVNFHHVDTEVGLTDEVSAAVRTHEGSLIALSDGV